MANRVWVGIVAIFVVAFLLYVAACAQGAPTQPTASLSNTLNPAVAQTLTVTLKTQAYALVAPNSVYEFGSKFVYSVSETLAGGTPTVIVQNASSAASPVSGNNNGIFYLTATVSFSTPVLCTVQTCPAQPVNLTVTAQAFVSTWLSFWSSPVSTLTFSNVPNYNVQPAAAAPSPYTYYLELYIPLTLAAFVIFLAITVIRPNDITVWLTILMPILALIEYLVWSMVL
jgi:hypothetical protein